VCDGGLIAIREADEAAVSPPGQAQSAAVTPGLTRLRFTFAKTGTARFLSHLEVSSALTRAIKRSGLTLRYSEGFHPHPKVSFAFATAVGMESLEEFADIQVEDRLIDAAAITARINAALPEGLAVRRISHPAAGDSSLAKLVRGFRYRIVLPPGDCTEGLRERISGFLAQSSFVVEREGKEKTTRKDVRPYVEGIALDRETGKLEMTLLFSEGRTVRPAEILTHALGLEPGTVLRAGMVKTETILADKRDWGREVRDEGKKE
jgi:radical SAM-linked protein